MALPNFLQFGKKYSNTNINLAKDTASELIDASQTSGSSIELGSGATTLAAGDFDTTYAGSGTDFVYSARGNALVTGSGSDTFAFGVGSKAQTAGMIGACVVDDSTFSNGKFENGETIDIAKNFFGTSSGQQMAGLAAAISNANSSGLNADGSGLNADGSRTLVIDSSGDKITFLSGEKLNSNHFKLV